MRKISPFIILALASVLLFGTTGCFTQLEYVPEADEEYYETDYGYYDDQPLSFFYELDWYGRWVYSDRFGWVWQPDVVRGWRPYYNGHWAWDGFDWVWVSYEPFGWATYHYGFWTYDPVWGWLWLPDYEWYPSRVSWAIYDDYIAWAPMPPPGMYLGDPWVHPVTQIWIVVPYEMFVSPDVGRYHVRDSRPYTRYKSPTRISLNPPQVQRLEKRLGRTIRPVDIKMDDVHVGGKNYKKMILPPSQKKQVERYEDRVSKKVFREDPAKQDPKVRRKPPPPQQKSTDTKKKSKDSTRAKSDKSKSKKEKK